MGGMSQFGATPAMNNQTTQQQGGWGGQMGQLGGAFGQMGLGGVQQQQAPVAPAAAAPQQQVNPFADLGSFEKKQPTPAGNSLNVDLWG